MLPFRARPASTLLIVFLAVGALPSPARSQVTRNDYAARRTAVLSGIDSGVVVAFGEVEPVSYWLTFFQVPSFYYLTGFGETDAALVLVKRKDGPSAAMFVPSRNAVQERWIGARTKSADMRSKTGIDGRDIAELIQRLTRWRKAACLSTSFQTCRRLRMSLRIH